MRDFFISPEYIECLRLKDDALDMGELGQKHSLLNKNNKKKNVHPYDEWVNLREVQDLLLRRDHKRPPIAFPMYGTES